MIFLIRKLNYSLIIILFAVQICIVFSQVIWRFIFNNPFSWSEEIARYLQVWIILFSSSVCIEKSRHLSIDYLKGNISKKFQKLLHIISYVMISVFSISIIVYGIQFIMRVGYQSTPSVQLPLGIIYIAFPIAGFHMLLESLIILKNIFNNKY